MRCFLVLVMVALGSAAAACGDDGPPAPPFDSGVTPDGPEVVTCSTCWVPKPGEFKNWDVQLTAPFDISTARAMYDLDLFDVVPSPQTVTYADGALTIPAGTLATAIADLHAAGTKVVCHVGAGLIDVSDPDASKFPVEVLGASTVNWQNGFDNDRYVDIRSATVLEVVKKRLDLAKTIGCDAVEADGIDQSKDAPGFPVVEADVIAYFQKVAAEAHRRELSVGMKNVWNTPTVIAELPAIYDWMMVVRCAEFNDCGKETAFVVAQKAVFGFDVAKPDANGNGVDAATACPIYGGAMVDGIIKDDELTKTRTACP
jgi:hypothetical protein